MPILYARQKEPVLCQQYYWSRYPDKNRQDSEGRLVMKKLFTCFSMLSVCIGSSVQADGLIFVATQDTDNLQELYYSNVNGTGAGITISTAHSGVTTVNFADTGQSFRISGVQSLTFSDGHVVHL